MACTETCHRPNGRQAHCGVCHRSFTGITTFDMHRVRGNCVMAAGLTEKENVWGMWGSRTNKWWE